MMFVRTLVKEDVAMSPRCPPPHFIEHYLLVLAAGRLWVLPNNVAIGDTPLIRPLLVRAPAATENEIETDENL